MKLTIPYSKLEFMYYEGAGNRTPVLDISATPNVTSLSPHEVRTILEQDQTFRNFLQEKGKALHADSVMVFYKAVSEEFEFVTFVGEPNAEITNSFSDMCGNGIRCLALHIFLTAHKKDQERYQKDGMRIWAGNPKQVWIESIDLENNTAFVRVAMGGFQRDKEKMQAYMHTKDVMFRDKGIIVPEIYLPRVLHEVTLGVGFNGDYEGEPHLVFFLTEESLSQLLPVCGITIDYSSTESITRALSRIVSIFGKELTFQRSLFQHYINVNIGFLRNGKIYMATHERNLVPSKDICRAQQMESETCQCNTRACGTGGAAVANIAKIQGLIAGETITTVHPGGEIAYVLASNETYMIGPAERKDYHG